MGLCRHFETASGHEFYTKNINFIIGIVVCSIAERACRKSHFVVTDQRTGSAYQGYSRYVSKT